MKVLGFAASSSTKSINKMLVTYAVSLLTDTEVEILDLNDYELPLFSEDKEEELGKDHHEYDRTSGKNCDLQQRSAVLEPHILLAKLNT